MQQNPRIDRPEPLVFFDYTVPFVTFRVVLSVALPTHGLNPDPACDGECYA
jgi:hypothetical protein